MIPAAHEMDLSAALLAWTAAPWHTQHLRRLALEALSLCCPAVLVEAREAAAPEAWAWRWRLCARGTSEAPAWLLAAVVLDGDAFSFQRSQSPCGWLLPYGGPLPSTDAPAAPSEARRRLIGHARFIAEVRQYLKDLADHELVAAFARPAGVEDRKRATADGNLERDLLIWAKSVVTAAGEACAAFPGHVPAEHSDPLDIARSVANDLGLDYPRDARGRVSWSTRQRGRPRLKGKR